MVPSSLLDHGQIERIRELIRKGGPEGEICALEEVYRAIRNRIKRGRIFVPEQALCEGKADCLAYARIFETVAAGLGLDVGVIEVIVDNAGRFVHHPANVFKPSNERVRIVDLWYGSTDINHLRLCVQVLEGDRWVIKDLAREDLSKTELIKGLPRRCLEAITNYTYGNIYLNRGQFAEAIRFYTQAIELYPENPRFYFNRSLAYEACGDPKKAQEDRERAFSCEEMLPRLLATEHEEITRLIGLDELGIPEEEQHIYLLSHGYITGAPLSPPEVSRRTGIASEKVRSILNRIEERLRECYHGKNLREEGDEAF